jgi:hypothetical protein
MTDTIETLGEAIRNETHLGGSVEMPKRLLAGVGIPFDSVEYSKWLTRFGLRQMRSTAYAVFIGVTRVG